MIGRLLRKRDFERTLAIAPCSRSAHFAVHHLHAWPSAAAKPLSKVAAEQLCTAHAPADDSSVDNLVSGHWLGHVLPKRHARRAVTRNLLRRQVREAMLRQQSLLAPGLWLVRLRQAFPVKDFPSANSASLRAAAAAELDQLLARAGR